MTLKQGEKDCDELLDNINSRMDFAHQRKLLVQFYKLKDVLVKNIRDEQKHKVQKSKNLH